jgi:hypothetical protein
MDIETAKIIYNMYDPRPMLNDEEQSLFSKACDTLLENDLMEEDGTLVNEE